MAVLSLVESLRQALQEEMQADPSVIVLGEVSGNVTASEKVDIRDNGSVDGDIASPRVAIAEGAHFRGSVDMQRAGQKAQQPQPQQSAKPADKPQQGQSQQGQGQPVRA